MVVMLEQPMNGSITIILLIKHAHPIKLMVMITELVVQLKLNAKTVFQAEDAGLKKELKFMELISMVMSKENKT